VFRPSVVFGPEDRFLNLFATLARFLPVLALACPEAKFQPVYVGDVARSWPPRSTSRDASASATSCAAARLHAARAGRLRLRGHRPAAPGRRPADRLSLLQAWMLEHLPGKLMTRDNVRSMQVPNVCSDALRRSRPRAAVARGRRAFLPRAAGPRERYPQLRWRARR
jgi:NADH dehydrogenase